MPPSSEFSAAPSTIPSGPVRSRRREISAWHSSGLSYSSCGGRRRYWSSSSARSPESPWLKFTPEDDLSAADQAPHVEALPGALSAPPIDESRVSRHFVRQ